MTTDLHNPNCQPAVATHLPMGGLLDLLNSNGFTVKPEDYIELLKITERFGSADIDQTARWICPAIVTSEQEQEKFYHLVEQYKANAALPPCPTPAERYGPVSKYYRLLLILLVPVFLLIYNYSTRITCVLNEPQKNRTVAVNKSIVLDASPLLQHCGSDTGIITCRWVFDDDGSIYSGSRAVHTFRRAGNFLVVRHFSSSAVNLTVKSDSLRIEACDHLPTLQLTAFSGAISARLPVTLTAVTGGDTSGITGYQWSVHDSVFSTSGPQAANVVFPAEGFYTVECRAVAGTVSSPCTVVARDNIQVVGRDKNYQAVFSAPLQKKFAGKPVARGWVSLLLLVVAASGLVFPFISSMRRKKLTATPPAGKPSTATGPYEIPFASATELLQREPLLRRIMLQMRYQAAEETYLLNINATINSIITAGGSPQLVFAPRKKQQNYLLLVERINTKGMMPRLFEALAKTLDAEGLPADLFFYDKNFTCFNDKHPAGISLNRLANTRQQDVLLIMGTGYNLVYPVYPEMEEKHWKDLSRWQKKALITPVPFREWSVKETVLRQWLIVLPADIMALGFLIPALRENTRISTALLETSVAPVTAHRDTDFREVASLQEYLGDEYLFQWLCAICIYPKLRWELLLEIGKVILDKYGKPECLNYSNLLKLCRITWVQQGVFPQATRLELLKKLQVGNELAAREKLLELLNYSGTIYGEGNRFFEEEKLRLIITNQFILQAGNQTRYFRYNNSRKAFRKLWLKDALFDAPLKKYLDKKPGDNWTTPLAGHRGSVGASLYFSQGKKVATRKRTMIRLISFTSALVATGAWLFLMYGNRGSGRISFPMLQSYQYPESVPVDFMVTKSFAACADTSGNRFRQLDGYLQLGNTKYPMQYSAATGLAGFRLPYQRMALGTATILFAWEINRTASATLDLTGDIPGSVQISCAEGNPALRKPLEVRFNDSSGYEKQASRLSSILNGYTINTVYEPFNDPSKLVYHAQQDKPVADSIVGMVERDFGSPIREIYLPSKKKMLYFGPPQLFVNTRTSLKADSSKAVATVHQQSDYYHAMADNLFMKKQNGAALMQYQLAIEGDPTDALAWYQSGVCYELLGDKHIPEAISAYSAAIRIRPSDPDYYYRRATLEFSEKKYKAAIADHNQVIVHSDKSNPGTSYTSAYYYRGKSKLAVNDVSGACNDFKQAADLGMQEATRDFGSYCAVQDSAGTNQVIRQKRVPFANQQKQQGAVPGDITPAQLVSWLMEVAYGKITGADLIKSLGGDLPVQFNGESITVSDMCKRLVATENIAVLKAELVKDNYDLLTGLKVTTANAPSKK